MTKNGDHWILWDTSTGRQVEEISDDIVALSRNSERWF